jgi:hypothetical protein
LDVVVLKRMYGMVVKMAPPKKELMEYGDLLTNFFGCDKKGKDVLDAVDNYSWEMLD